MEPITFAFVLVGVTTVAVQLLRVLDFLEGGGHREP